MRHWFLMILIAGFTGCASQPAEDDAVAATEQDVVCRTERELGSTFKRRVCKTAAEWRAEQDAAQDIARNRRPGYTEVNPPGTVRE